MPVDTLTCRLFIHADNNKLFYNTGRGVIELPDGFPHEMIRLQEENDRLKAVLEAAKNFWFEEDGVMVLDAGSWELNVLKRAIGAFDERFLK